MIDAAATFDRAFPMMMTAAGTIRPAKVFVMGAGVAGLQAIATAKRLGAVVTATDVRPAAKEQVESLGGKFIAVEDDEFKQAETAGGYAKEMSPAYKEKQAALTASHIAKQDIVITTALIPGRPAPRLDQQGDGRIDGAGLGDRRSRGRARRQCRADRCRARWSSTTASPSSATRNVPGRIATSASQLYARNLLAFLETLIDKKAKTLAVNWDDELVKATVLTRDGAVVHPNFVTKAGEPRVAAVTPPKSAEKAALTESEKVAIPAMARPPKPPVDAASRCRTGRSQACAPAKKPRAPRKKAAPKADTSGDK